MTTEEPVYDDDGNDTGETECRSPETDEINEELSYFRERLSNVKDYPTIDLKDWDQEGLRSYPSRFIKSWGMCKRFAGVYVDLELNAKVTSGYHEGACLDWDFKMTLNHCEYDDFDVADFTDHCDHNAGVAAFTYPKANKWANNMKDQMINDMEAIFAELSGIQLEVVATASNGETFYKQVNPIN